MESTVAQAEALLALDAGDAAEAARAALGRRSWRTRWARRATPRGCARWRARVGAAGEREAAPALLKQAEPELAACGVDRLRAEAARDLRRLGVRVSARQRRGGGEGPGVLSGREREIAELVALGRTNREIAGELFVCEKTVEGHLRNVFAKLGVSSRAAVAEVVGRSRTPDN